MANYERRSSSRDDDRVFDGGDDEDEGEGSHLPVVIIIAMLVLAAFGGVVWLAYNQGVARGRNDVPVRVAGNETGGQIKVYQQPAGAEAEEPSANPMPRSPAAGAQKQAPARKVAGRTAAPAALTPVKRKPVPPPPRTATKPPAQLGMAKRPPASKHAPKPVVGASLKPSMGGSAYALQVGAYKSYAEAMAAWKIYKGKHASLLAGYSPDVQKADLGPKGVWYRLRVTPFADKSAALTLCDRLKAQNGACFLAR